MTWDGLIEVTKVGSLFQNKCRGGGAWDGGTGRACGGWAAACRRTRKGGGERYVPMVSDGDYM